MKIKELLENKSVKQLNAYLNKSGLTKKEETYINKLIKKGKEANELFFKSFRGNYIFKLALYQLKRKGKAEKYYKGACPTYEFDFAKILIAMSDITKKLTAFKNKRGDPDDN